MIEKLEAAGQMMAFFFATACVLFGVLMTAYVTVFAAPVVPLGLAVMNFAYHGLGLDPIPVLWRYAGPLPN